MQPKCKTISQQGTDDNSGKDTKQTWLTLAYSLQQMGQKYQQKPQMFLTWWVKGKDLF